MTIGNPKMIGSLTLKIPGPIDNLPICFNCFERMKRRIATTTASVEPEPPIPTV